MKKLFRQPLAWLAVGSIAVALLWPRLSKNDKFPYVGTWKGSVLKNKKGYEVAIEFRGDGSCGYINKTPTQADTYNCSYRMSGRQALLTTSFKVNQEINVIDSKITPQDNGSKVLFVPMRIMVKRGEKKVGGTEFHEQHVLNRIK